MIVIPNMRDGYKDVVNTVISNGRKVAPRGQATLEVPDMVVILLDPTDALPLGTGRGINMSIAAVEACQIIGGFVDPELMVRISPKFTQFMDNGKFWGGYGTRIGTQLIAVYDKLKADPATRQAVIEIWDPKLDNVQYKHDYPCTLSLTFAIRDDKLELHTTMRSNDVWLGFAYDVFVFTQLQLTLAGVLGMEVGPYYHHAVSMHLYERDFADSLKLHDTDWQPDRRIVGFGEDQSIIGAQWRADMIGHNQISGLASPTFSEFWYHNQLKKYFNA